MRRFVLLAALLCLTGSVALAQDPVKVDPKHYKVEFENSAGSCPAHHLRSPRKVSDASPSGRRRDLRHRYAREIQHARRYFDGEKHESRRSDVYSRRKSPAGKSGSQADGRSSC